MYGLCLTSSKAGYGGFELGGIFGEGGVGVGGNLLGRRGRQNPDQKHQCQGEQEFEFN
jgi:hypothetical protein